MSGRARKVGLVGAIAGAVATGVAIGLAGEQRTVARARTRPDPEAREPFGRLPATRSSVVIADDGVPLHVDEVGDRDAPVTIVFCHGYVVDSGCWHYQRRDLGDVGRLVFWDQRSHGRSGRSSERNCTIDQLGRDLSSVIDHVAPDGPVVLVGHSMGGMTIMALADPRPHYFQDHVVGVALVSTSPGRLAEVTFGLPEIVTRLSRTVLPWVRKGAQLRPGPIERGRRLGTDLSYLITRRWSFGSKDASPALVEFVERMVAATPVDVIADFYPTFLDHDKLEALPVLDRIETLVLVGEKDLQTPVEHSREIAAAVPSAQLVTLPGAGHMVMLERPSLVNLHLRAFVRRALSRSARAA